jgi:signal transduction histidine kinase
MAGARTDFGNLARNSAPLVDYKAGDVIFKQGDGAQELFIVKSGKVEIRLGDRVVDTLFDNDIFGEMALIDPAPRSATAVAITDTTLITISANQFLGSVSDLALDVMRVIVRRQRKREREHELMNIEALTASIAHEVRQPLSGIATYAGAARNFLGMSPPNINKVRELLSEIAAGVHRADEVLDAVRSLFGSAGQVRRRIDMNEMTAKLLQSMHAELEEKVITTFTDFSPEIPLVEGNRDQLQQVIFNLVRNAVEAMDSIKDRDRVLRLKTGRHGGNMIALVVQDSGRGIDPKQLDRIFGPFVTTKAHGMGLGLAICRMIVERHSGQLTASSDGETGALFQLVLPVGSIDQPATPVENR